MLHMLHDLTPRFVPGVPFVQERVVAVIYTDAFFELGERVWKPGDPDIPNTSFQQASEFRNGWGFVVRIGNHVTYGHGSVSPTLLRRFCHRRAYIYFLEIYAQLVAFCIHVRALPSCWLAYVDNQPGLTALQKGFGRDERINTVISAFWSLATQARWVPEFRWVPSELNISDPISRGSFDVVQPSWHRLHGSCQDLENLILKLEPDTVSSFYASVCSLKWTWDPPFGGVEAPSDGAGQPPSTRSDTKDL